MAKNTPSFQFYPSDFLGGVQMLSEAETGVYIKLLCALWINANSLPFRFSKLARATATPQEELEKLWPSIEDKFIIEDGTVMHARFQKMMHIAEIKRQNGSQGGRPKKPNENLNGNQNGNQNKTNGESKTKAPPLKNEERSMKTEDSSSEDWVFPDGWDSPELREALEGWAQMRIKKGKRIKSRKSTSKIFKKFDSPEHLAEVAEHCEANEYQGLNPDYCRNGKKRKQEGAVNDGKKRVSTTGF